jgi:hypothetical protein
MIQPIGCGGKPLRIGVAANAKNKPAKWLAG